MVTRTEPEIKTHTSYLTFATLPREWTASDEEECAEFVKSISSGVVKGVVGEKEKKWQKEEGKESKRQKKKREREERKDKEGVVGAEKEAPEEGEAVEDKMDLDKA